MLHGDTEREREKKFVVCNVIVICGGGYIVGKDVCLLTLQTKINALSRCEIIITGRSCSARGDTLASRDVKLVTLNICSLINA